ncbi:MAG: hypothetical protein ABI294_06055 [Casimicrobiaceae bacterium]
MHATADTGRLRSDAAAIFLGGLIAGSIDIGAAALINQLGVGFILRVVAGGVLGNAALAGDASVALLGLVLQWAMSLIIAAIYLLVVRRFPMLRMHWVRAGVAYGVVIFFAMNYVVVPLSAWAKTPKFTHATFAENLLAMLLFGLIVAWFAHRVNAGADDRTA